MVKRITPQFLFEMFGVAMINNIHRDLNWKSLALLVIGFGASFTFLSYAMETLPMGQLMEYGRELLRHVEQYLE